MDQDVAQGFFEGHGTPVDRAKLPETIYSRRQWRI
jgi:hypothetical protein